SDLYSLGVVFYQMLTGALPFTASDPTEWVHCHVARKPAPPGDRVETVPAPISKIVMKLLAKAAETRYGRASEVAILPAGFERIVQGGAPEMVLVSGYSGIGKSAVVNELHKVLVPLHGLFA